MIGVLVGAAAVAGFIALKRHRHRRWAAMGHGCGGGWHYRVWEEGSYGGGWDRSGHHHHHRHARFARWGQRRVLYAVLSELDCTPAQEKVIREEVDGLLDKLREVRGEKDATREDLARVVGGAELDRQALDAMFARHDQRLVAVRGEVTAALGRIHAVLDDRQRARLAELIGGGLRGWRGRGPYR